MLTKNPSFIHARVKKILEEKIMDAVGRSSGGILTGGGWKRIDINAQTSEGHKISLYCLRSPTVEKVERARQALEKEISEKSRDYLDGIEFFEEDIYSQPYLVKEANELYLITEQRKSEMMEDYFSKSFCNPENLEILTAKRYSDIGGQYALGGEPRRALQEYEKCLTIVTRLGDEKCMAGTHYNMGCIYRGLEKFQKAQDHYLKCLTLAKDLKTQEHFAKSSYHALGVICLTQGNKPMALECFQQYLEIATDQDAQEDMYKATQLIQLVLSQ